jgi:hypothetical protein
VGGRGKQEGGREGPLSALTAVARGGCVRTCAPYLWLLPAALEVRGGARGQVLGELPAALLSVALDVAAEWLQDYFIPKSPLYVTLHSTHTRALTSENVFVLKFTQLSIPY